ncbi:MAG TPA: hypothetical protein VIV60_21810, partial [Polyangiaceae bacterium]
LRSLRQARRADPAPADRVGEAERWGSRIAMHVRERPRPGRCSIVLRNAERATECGKSQLCYREAV